MTFGGVGKRLSGPTTVTGMAIKVTLAIGSAPGVAAMTLAAMVVIEVRVCAKRKLDGAQ